MPRHPSAARILPVRGIVAAGALLTGVLLAGCDLGGATLADEGPLRPTKLTFSIQPEYEVAGGLIGPGVAVTVLYNTGDTAFASTASIRLSIALGTGNPSAHLSGMTQMAAVNGTAMFSNLSIDSAGTGYLLYAASDGLGSAFSDSFDVKHP